MIILLIYYIHLYGTGWNQIILIYDKCVNEEKENLKFLILFFNLAYTIISTFPVSVGNKWPEKLKIWI